MLWLIVLLMFFFMVLLCVSLSKPKKVSREFFSWLTFLGVQD